MNAPSWLVAGLLCAQAGPSNMPPGDPAPRVAASRIAAVTVYRGQALVTREVAVPAGLGVVELVVSPLPAATVAGSLATEGGDGVRILSTRFRARAVREDTRGPVGVKEAELKQLGLDAQVLQGELATQQQDVLYLNKLENFTGTSLTGLTEKGRLDAPAILDLSNYLMTRRGEKAKAATELRLRLQANAEATESARRELAELAAGRARTERDAVIVLRKDRPEAATVRFGHLVDAATWTPQYRLRGAADDAPVRLEYLAAVVQTTGEDWPAARITLSTARPTLDAAPPDLLPLKVDVAGDAGPGAVETHDGRSERLRVELARPIDMTFPRDTSLEDVVRHIRQSTAGPDYPNGIPIYVDPNGLVAVDRTLASTVTLDLRGIPLKTTLRLLLEQLDLVYRVADGLLTITSRDSEDDAGPFPPRRRRPDRIIGGAMGGMGGGIVAGMGGEPPDPVLSLEQAQASTVARLNADAAGDQAEELAVGDDPAAGPAPGRDDPSVSFAVAGPVGIASRPDPQLLEVGRLELPAEYYAQAVPVLTPRVYRLAKLTNRGDLVLLPGEATVYAGGEFVGRMSLPLVAAGEPFVVGFGVDPQLQVARRLVRKARTIQGGNQVFAYEFRIALRNYRPTPVRVQLWDRLPAPEAEAEAVLVNLASTSLPLSVDPLYLRTGRADNLLRWDLDLPPGTTGDNALALTYEFRLEYARDLPRPRFLAGDLAEGPIGGPAAGGVGAMGGFRSVRPARR